VSRILIVSSDTGGPAAAAVGVGAELARRGHDVRVLGHVAQYRAVHDAGLSFAARSTALDPARALPERQFAAARVALAVDPRSALDVRAELARRRPDVVVVEATELAALREAERSGLPVVVLAATLHGYLTRTWARGPIGLATTLRRLRPGKLWGAAARVLVATDPQLDPDAGTLPSNAVHTGAVLGPTRPPAREPDPFVAVSLSTGYQPAQADALQRILDALGTLDVTATVSVGDGVDAEPLRAPGNVVLHRYVDHDDVLARAHLLIGHGGHATTVRALANDLPVLVMPLHPLFEHAAVGAAVAQAGAGRVLGADAPAEAVAHAVRALLGGGRHHAAAAEVGARLRARDGAAAAADEIERLHPS
jgi:UDP:flavonoid glycosyltransferase YjiC (YdhE family)